jgi:hypothetical protein
MHFHRTLLSGLAAVIPLASAFELAPNATPGLYRGDLSANGTVISEPVLIEPFPTISAWERRLRIQQVLPNPATHCVNGRTMNRGDFDSARLASIYPFSHKLEPKLHFISS